MWVPTEAAVGERLAQGLNGDRRWRKIGVARGEVDNIYPALYQSALDGRNPGNRILRQALQARTLPTHTAAPTLRAAKKSFILLLTSVQQPTNRSAGGRDSSSSLP